MQIPLPEGTFDALIFDCDGTLINSAPAHLHSIQQTLATFGHTMTPEWYAPRTGLTPADLLDAYEAEFKVDAIARQAFAERYKISFLDALPLIREVEAVTTIARTWHGRVPLAVASNGERINVEASLRAPGLLSLFDFIVTAADVPQGKPAPDIYLEAAFRMNVLPSRCLVFEDTDEGVTAAHTAGMRIIDVRPFIHSR
jgi:HAD superfamily hydrolase (TIGR01509 family)